MKTGKNNNSVFRLCITALFMALNVVLSSFGIPVPGGHLYLNDIIICTAALILDPLDAFFACGVGAFLGDLFFYPAPMFVSLFTHGLQGVVIARISGKCLGKKQKLADMIAVLVGAVIMVTGYTVGRAYIYSTPEYALIKLPYQIIQALLGVVFGLILVWKCGLREMVHKYLH